jgi:hypothetical protein
LFTSRQFWCQILHNLLGAVAKLQCFIYTRVRVFEKVCNLHVRVTSPASSVYLIAELLTHGFFPLKIESSDGLPGALGV